MVVARIKANMKKHFNDLLDTWAAKECTHRQIVEEIDELGNIINRSETDVTIYALISPINLKTNNTVMGHAQPGDLTMFAKYEDNIIISDQLTSTTTRHDNIIYEGIEYQIYNIEYAYDVNVSQVSHEPIFGNYHLKRITTN